MERTVVLIKPDALQRGLIGQVISRFERKGLKLVGIKMMKLDDRLLELHYAHLRERPFFEELKGFMQKTPIVAMCWEGVDCISTVRSLCGITNAREAAAGTIRGDFAMSTQANLVHASDGPDTARAELARFFGEGEVFSYKLAVDSYLYSEHE